MKRILSPRQLGALCAASLTLSSALAATSASDLTLDGVLEAALQRQGKPGEATPYSSSAWLAGLPSLDVSYLHSDEKLGTDETEVGLNLPLKSPFLREQDQRLRALARELQAAETDRRRLYYSGLIREAAWSARIAATRAGHAERKIALLQQLLQREQTLFDARGTSRYGVLLIRQELLNAQLRREDQRAESQRWLQRFRQLSGLARVPDSLVEPPLPPGQSWREHPALRQLDLAWEQQRTLIAAGSERAAPWHFRLGAKNLDSPLFEENQYGIAVQIPLGFIATTGQSSRSEWQQGARQYWRDRDELQITLEQSWQRLQLEAEHLQRRQALLDESAAVSDELTDQADALLAANELGRERWLQRLIADLDRQADTAINQLLIGQNRAMQRQAAGLPL